MNLITLILLLQSAINPQAEVGTLVDGVCSVCKKANKKSIVRMEGYTACTAMFCGSGHYDEEGKFIAPEACNTCTSSGKCSNGHTVVNSTKR